MNRYMNQSKKILEQIVFPIILAVYPLMMFSKGADLSDTTYSLGNYMFFDRMTGSWKYATYLANLMGKGLITLTGGRMIWMNLLIGLLLSVMALAVYYFFQRKWNAILVFLGEIIAISLCWCPVAILYNYLSYFVLTFALLFILLALEKDRPWILLPAGLLLGLNVFVRTPNLTQMALILVVWFDAWQKKNRKIWKETGICILGYLLGMGGCLLAMVLSEGTEGYLEMVNWLYSLLSSEDPAGGYSLSAMLLTILDNYFGNLKWLGLMLLGIIFGTGAFAVWKNKFVNLKKIAYMAACVLLFVYYKRNGMFSLQYYNVGSIWGPAVVFVMISVIASVWELLRKDAVLFDKRIALANIVLLFILPLGSNNHIYSVINYLFLALPFTLTAVWQFVQKYRKNVLAFPAYGMLILFGVVLLIQTCLFHGNFVFRDGINGEKRDAVLTLDSPMKGMHTNKQHANAMEELYAFVETRDAENILLYGNLPGLSYYLRCPSAISTSWPDLDSYSALDFAEELECLENAKRYPLVIISTAAEDELNLDGWDNAAKQVSEDNADDEDNAIENNENESNVSEMKDKENSSSVSSTYDSCSKPELLKQYLLSAHYECVFENQEFAVLCAQE